MSSHPVWDLPTRIFHWVLLLAVCVSWTSAEFDYYNIHQWSGYTILVLVVFRLFWGFVGSVHSRFSDFVSTPATVMKYLKGNMPTRVGHNPLGAWSVVALLLLLLAQALTGLFNSDELMYNGPFYYAVDSTLANQLGDLHEKIFWLLSTLILLHIAAVLYYRFGKGDNLLAAMFSGGSGGQAAPVPIWRALLVLAVCIACLAVAVYFAPAPKLPW